jgi:hypothetical protein
LAITYLEAIIERQSRVAVATLQVAQSTQLASLQATRSFTYLALSSPLFAVRFITQLATSFPFELLEQQVVLAKQLTDILVKPPSKATTVAPNAPIVTTVDDAAQSAARKTIETVVGEEVEIGKRRVDNVEHISDTVRHEELAQ